jgi:hypothetical protein
MSHLSNTLRAVAAAALMSGFTFAVATTATADPPNTGTPADVNTLAGSLSKGYGLNNCTPQQLTESGELAELICEQSPDPSGPRGALYALFSNGNDLAASFSATIRDVSLTACGDSGPSRATWQDSSGQIAGQVACGTYKNDATLTWTTDSKNTLGHITASNPDVNSLYEWWRANR